VAQAQSTLYSAQASIAQYTRQVAQDMDELVLLAGAPIPTSLLAQMNAETGLDAVPAFPELGAGLPADLLQRRPDILSAEHDLRAANANIGAARAAFFPEITLTANGGVESAGLSSLFNAAQGDWLFAPSLTLPIFNAGQNFANLDIAKLQKRIEIATYESTIQSAFHDTADALSARATYQDEMTAEQLLVSADTRNDQLSEMLFRSGTDGYLSVLVAKNALLTARLTLVGIKLATLQNTINLYKSLGGGWQSEMP
jgi:multidrug efflux system outer membrane protein